ncbi:MAG: transporter [Actinomycetota bacterium]
MTTSSRLAVLTMAATLAALPAVAADSRRPAAAETRFGELTVSTGIDYSTGKYGQAISTDIVSVPVTAKLEKDEWTAKLTVPWVEMTGPADVVQGVGRIRGRAAATATRSGLGDVTASLGRTVWDDRTNGTAVDVTGKIKFGTASAADGLGTGENDYSLAIEPSQRFGAVTAFGSLGYKIVGNPGGADLGDEVIGSLGASVDVAPGTPVGVEFTFQEPTGGSAAPQRDVTAFIDHHLNDQAKGQLYLVRGLADGSPDWGGGAMLSYRF